MEWHEKPLRIAALQCESEGDPLRVIDVWEDWGFNTEQLLHVSAEGYSGYYRPDRADDIRRYIERAHRKGIRIIFYLAPGAGAADLVTAHPEYLQCRADGTPANGGPCMNSPYRERLFEMVREVARLGSDGVFLDGPIVVQGACYCRFCRELFRAAHGAALPAREDIHDPLWHRFMEFRYDTIANCIRDARTVLKEVRPEAVFYMNSQGFSSGLACGRENRRLVVHQDILGAEGGFIFYVQPDKVPFWKPGATAKLIETQAAGKPTVVFVAGDHKAWHRHLHTAAETRLLYADTVANGASVWYGLHSPIDDIRSPGGLAAKEMNRFLRENESCYTATKSVARIALLRSTATMDWYHREIEQSDFTRAERGPSAGALGNAALSFNGFYEMLLRSHVLFDVIDEEALVEPVMAKYDTLVLPNCACLSDGSITAITRWVEAGGNVVASLDTSLYDGLVNRKTDFGLGPVFGVSYAGDAYRFGSTSYASLEGEHAVTSLMSQRLVPAPSVGLVVTTTTGRTVMRFRRPVERQYQPIPEEATPAVVVNTFGKGRSVYLAGNYGEHYSEWGLPAHLLLVGNAVRWLSRPILDVTDAPQTLEVVLREQPTEHRYLLHLVNFTGEMRRPFQAIVPCHDVGLCLHTDRPVRSVRCLAERQDLRFEQGGGTVRFRVPRVGAYEVVVIGFVG